MRRFALISFLLFSPALQAQSWKAPNPDVQNIVESMSKDRLEAIVRKLESFESRLKDVSIDEWVFGVRAIGQNGTESLTSAYVNPPRAKATYKTLP